jgi:excisionase family DNA binding protein
MGDEALLKVHEVAELLGLSVGGVYQMVSAKRIPVVKFSARCIRFEKRELEKWMASLTVPADSTVRGRSWKQVSRGKRRDKANEG